MICIWSSWCHCHPIISCSSKIQNGLPFWCRLTHVVLEKRPLNGRSSSSVSLTAKTSSIHTEVSLHGGWGRPVPLTLYSWSSGNAPQQSNFLCIFSRTPSASRHPVRNNDFCWLGPIARHTQATMNWTINSRNSRTMYCKQLKEDNPRHFCISHSNSRCPSCRTLLS